MNRLRGFKKQKGPPAIKDREIDRDLYLGGKEEELNSRRPGRHTEIATSF